MENIFNRAQILLGGDAMRRLANARVILFGVGGVGSWCAESLIRTGLGHLTIVDPDCVTVTNVNRQMMATTLTIGRVKVETLKSRLLEINPDAEIEAIQDIYSEETAENYDLENYDVVIDCIDSLKDKVLLIERATSVKTKFFSSMGAARKLDPTRIKTAEFRNVEGCPLARALRQRFKRMHRFPRRKFLCVYSDELIPNAGNDDAGVVKEELGFNKVQLNGSLMHITAIFGMTLAGLAISYIIAPKESGSQV